MHQPGHSPVHHRTLPLSLFLAALGLWVSACPGPEEAAPAPSATATETGGQDKAGSEAPPPETALPDIDAQDIEHSVTEASSETTPENAEAILDSLEAALADE